MRLHLAFQPTKKIGEKRIGILFKFERMMRPGILVDFLVGCGKSFDESSRLRIVDDPIAFGEQQQNRHRDMRHGESQIQIEPHALDEKARRGPTNRQRIVADELLPVWRGREQLRIAERHIEKSSWRYQTRQQDTKAFLTAGSDLWTKSRT